MAFSRNHVFRSVYRTLFVASAGVATGFLFYGPSIFVPTKAPFQFTLNGITAGLFYGVSKSMSYRGALAATLIWCVFSTLLDVHNWWLFVTFFVYAAGILASVSMYMMLVKKPLFNGILQRVATISILTGFFNALALLVLYAIQSTFLFARFGTVAHYVFENFQLGTLIGLGIGVGIEIAEYFLRLDSFQEFIQGEKTH